MIAIPLKLNKENSAVAPLFGKAKWFAFVENGNITIEKNEAQGGSGVVKWLLGKGVKTLIMQKMSQPPTNAPDIVKSHERQQQKR